METDLGKFPSFPKLERARPEFLARLGENHPRSLESFSSRSLGQTIRDARSSWVRLITIGSNTYYVKTYDYPSLRARSRGWFRNTAIAESRPIREWRALQWLASQGFPSPIPCAVFIQRQLTGIRRATLVTSAWVGVRLDQLLPELSTSEQSAVISAVCSQVQRMHLLGYRDRNLDLRNLLARKDESDSWLIAKIDSPRFRMVAAGNPADRLAQEDWQRLQGSLGRIGLALRLPAGKHPLMG